MKIKRKEGTAIQDNIILYSTGCPKCQVLKKKMENKGIDYVENNDENYMIKIGLSSVPYLEANGKFMNFNEAVKWVNGYGN